MSAQHVSVLERGVFNTRVKNVEKHLKKALKKHECLTHCFNALSEGKTNDAELNDVVNKVIRNCGGNSEHCFETYEAKQVEFLAKNCSDFKKEFEKHEEDSAFDAIAFASLNIEKFHQEAELLKTQLTRAFLNADYRQNQLKKIIDIHEDNLTHLDGNTARTEHQNQYIHGAKQFIDIAKKSQPWF
jgi:hypothetical protein